MKYWILTEGLKKLEGNIPKKKNIPSCKKFPMEKKYSCKNNSKLNKFFKRIMHIALWGENLKKKKKYIVIGKILL